MSIQQIIQAVQDKKNFSDRKNHVHVEYRDDRDRINIYYKGAHITIYFASNRESRAMVQVQIPYRDSNSSYVIFLNKLMAYFKQSVKFRSFLTDIFIKTKRGERILQSNGLYKSEILIFDKPIAV